MSGRVEITTVPKPWGYEKIWAHTDRYVGKILHINAGHALSLQYHERKDETVYLLSGEMKYWVEAGAERRATRDERGTGGQEGESPSPVTRHPSRHDAESRVTSHESLPEMADVRLRAGEAFRIAPGTIHYMEAVTDCDVLEVSTPELGDVVRLRDRYGREGTSAP